MTTTAAKARKEAQLLEMIGACVTLSIQITQKTDYMVWAQFMGHVNSFEITVRPKGNPIGDVVANSTIYLDAEQANKALKEIKTELEKMLASGELTAKLRATRLAYCI